MCNSKIKCFNYKFRQQLKEIEEKAEKGISYEPNVWWFKKLSFLRTIKVSPDEETKKRESFWEEFIELYRSLPEIWDPQHKSFLHGDARQEAYQKLTNKFKEKNVKANLEMTKAKLRSIRGRYRKQLNKNEKRKQMGLGDVPKVTWFEKLSFLGDLKDYDKLAGINKSIVDTDMTNSEVLDGSYAASVSSSFKEKVSFYLFTKLL